MIRMCVKKEKHPRFLRHSLDRPGDQHILGSPDSCLMAGVVFLLQVTGCQIPQPYVLAVLPQFTTLQRRGFHSRQSKCPEEDGVDPRDGKASLLKPVLLTSSRLYASLSRHRTIIWQRHSTLDFTLKTIVSPTIAERRFRYHGILEVDSISSKSLGIAFPTQTLTFQISMQHDVPNKTLTFQISMQHNRNTVVPLNNRFQFSVPWHPLS